MEVASFLFVVLLIFVIVAFFKCVTIVPHQHAFVIERLGKYSGTLQAGMHFLIPFMDVIKYKHSLKEAAYDIPAQVCITQDNVQVGVDGVLYMQIFDPYKTSYGIGDYVFAISQLCQTTMRSEIGKLALDKTFEERTLINNQIVTEVDKASDPWGVKVLRYEIKNITPPRDVLEAMEKQMRAEREKRAQVLTSEGERDSAINVAEGKKQEVIKASEADKMKKINEAEGQSHAILAVAKATAEGLKDVAIACEVPGGDEALKLKIAQQYIDQFGQLAGASNTMILPANLSDVGSMIAMATEVFTKQKDV